MLIQLQVSIVPQLLQEAWLLFSVPTFHQLSRAGFGEKPLTGAESQHQAVIVFEMRLM
ncbi:hypothetical protein FRB95_012476 [Tulasnella sp. JGI-2019a]|nr:hypothetical protein FRB95_012476 [Tulasnella sp. JGI-2019a]